MKWLSALLGRPSSEAKTRLLPGGLRVEVVGESHYQDALSRIAGGRKADRHDLHVLAALVLEPTNPYDPNAVRVEVNGLLVGHLDRKMAVAFQPVLRRLAERSEIGACRATIVGGWYRSPDDQGSFGIRLDLAAPERLLASLG